MMIQVTPHVFSFLNFTSLFYLTEGNLHQLAVAKCKNGCLNSTQHPLVSRCQRWNTSDPWNQTWALHREAEQKFVSNCSHVNSNQFTWEVYS